jgi:hypothetical protein
VFCVGEGTLDLQNQGGVGGRAVVLRLASNQTSVDQFHKPCYRSHQARTCPVRKDGRVAQLAFFQAATSSDAAAQEDHGHCLSCEQVEAASGWKR